jgi:putative addiction module killer protein
MVDKDLWGLAAMREVRKTDRYDRWFRRLRDEQAKARITARIFAIANDHLGDAKGVGDGGLEARTMGKGPGYCLYFILKGSELVVLLAGGDKGSQRADSSNAKLEAQALALH